MWRRYVLKRRKLGQNMGHGNEVNDEKFVFFHRDPPDTRKRRSRSVLNEPSIT